MNIPHKTTYKLTLRRLERVEKENLSTPREVLNLNAERKRVNKQTNASGKSQGGRIGVDIIFPGNCFEGKRVDTYSTPIQNPADDSDESILI